MANNKVVLNNETLIDISTDTVEPSKVLDGYTFHDKNGNAQSGNIYTNINTLNYMTTKNPVTLSEGYYAQPPSVYLDPTSAENIIPKNIKLGVEILGVTGAYSGGAESTVNWMIASLPTTITAGACSADCSNGGIWAALVTNKGVITSTDNGTVWNTTDITSGGGSSYRMIFGNGIFMTNAQNKLIYSNDEGTTWNVAEPSGAPDNKPIGYSNGYWIITSASMGSWYTQNGTSFTSTGIYNYQTFETPYDFVYFRNKWVTATSKGLKYSTLATPSGFIASNITGSAFNCLATSSIQASPFIVAGGTNGIVWSNDGINWEQSNITTGSIKKIETNGSAWVAVGTIGILYSSDGKNWSIVESIGPFNDVTYAAGKWIACSFSSYGLYDSTDGTDWAQSNISSGKFYSVNVKNGRFVACGDNGIYYATI